VSRPARGNWPARPADCIVKRYVYIVSRYKIIAWRASLASGEEVGVMWEDLTIALCAVGFVVVIAVLLVELPAVLKPTSRRHSHGHHHP